MTLRRGAIALLETKEMECAQGVSAPALATEFCVRDLFLLEMTPTCFLVSKARLKLKPT